MTENPLAALRQIWFCNTCNEMLEESTDYAYHKTKNHYVSIPLYAKSDIEELLKDYIPKSEIYFSKQEWRDIDMGLMERCGCRPKEFHDYIDAIRDKLKKLRDLK